MTRSRDPIPRAAALLAGTLLAGVVLRSTWDSADGFVRAVDDYRLLFADFVLQYRPAAEEIARTGAPYPGYYYSAAFALALSPFARMSEAASLAAWGCLQAISAALLAVLSASRARGFVPLAFAAFVFFTSAPVLHNFKWGQVSILVTLLALAAAAGRSSRPIFAGIGLAAATAIKFYPALFALPAVLRLERKFLVAFVAALAVFLAIVPAVFLGVHQAITFPQKTAEAYRRDAPRHVQDVNSQYFPHVVERWSTALSKDTLAPIPVRGGPGRAACAGTGLAVAAVALFLAHRLAARGIDDAPWWGALLLCGALPFAVATSWPHYLVATPALQATAARELGRLPLAPRIAGIVLLSFSIVLGSLLPWTRVTDWRTYVYFGGPFFASAGAFALLAILAAHRLRAASTAVGAFHRAAAATR